MNSDDNESCWSCGEEASETDKFCRSCGKKFPAQVFTWDWRDQPNFGVINERLRPFGVEIIEVETGTDQHAARVQAIGKEASHG